VKTIECPKKRQKKTAFMVSLVELKIGQVDIQKAATSKEEKF
jgi:hypothetical protein